jgi:hypothetical protein
MMWDSERHQWVCALVEQRTQNNILASNILDILRRIELKFGDIAERLERLEKKK